MEIVFNNVTYKNLKNISFKLNSNSIIGILSNEYIKTTLLDILSLNKKIDNGNILIDNKNIYNSFIDISYLKQNINDYVFKKTVYEELNIKNSLFTIEEMLELFSLDKNILYRNIYTLSSSEKRKILILKVLSRNSMIYLLDCPDRLLDDKTKLVLSKFLRMLKVKYNKQIIIVSNDIDFIHSVCDDLLIINNKVIYGNKYDLIKNNDLLSNNIDNPKLIEISNLIYEKKGIKIGYRDDINDLIKDIFRYAK